MNHLIRMTIGVASLCSPLVQTQLHAHMERADAIRPLYEGLSIPEGLVVKGVDGEMVDLTTLMRSTPSILVFYRGGWCPYCNQQLAELAGLEDEVVSIGYQIFALSPDRGESLKGHGESSGEAFRLFSDSDHVASDAFGVSFKVDEQMHRTLMGYGIDIEEASGNASRILPTPAVFVVRDGIIRFAYVNPDYKVRLDGDVLLAAARAAAK
jgi:peroxiredoxin